MDREQVVAGESALELAQELDLGLVPALETEVVLDWVLDQDLETARRASLDLGQVLELEKRVELALPAERELCLALQLPPICIPRSASWKT